MQAQLRVVSHGDSMQTQHCHWYRMPEYRSEDHVGPKTFACIAEQEYGWPPTPEMCLESPEHLPTHIEE